MDSMGIGYDSYQEPEEEQESEPISKVEADTPQQENQATNEPQKNLYGCLSVFCIICFAALATLVWLV